MSDPTHCVTGDWVEVRYELLGTDDRSSNLPPDTAATPLLAWVKGFARKDAEIGQPVQVETLTGRLVGGVLTDVNPGYTHTFGRPSPELVHVGADLRARVAGYRAGAPAHEDHDAAPASGAARDAGPASDAGPRAGD